MSQTLKKTSKRDESDHKRDLERMGIFSDIGYVTSNEPYSPAKIEFCPNRVKGKQMVTQPTKKGHHTKDVYFGKEYIRLFENEGYTDVVKIRRKWRLEESKKNIGPAFKPVSVPAKPSGKGSVYGTIQKSYPLRDKFTENDGAIPKPNTEESTTKKKEPEKKNFYTSPPKKGGFGYPNITIGKSYEYASEPYDAMREKEKAEREQSKQKNIIDKTFVPPSAKVGYFSPFVALEKDKSGPPPKPALPVVPFKPPSYPQATINPFPKYDEPSPNKKDDNDAKARREQADKKHEGVFRPVGIAHSYPIRSIVEANIPIIPDWLRKTNTAHVAGN